MVRQDSTSDQMASVLDLATKAGCYDAADIIKLWLGSNGPVMDALAAENARLRTEAEAMRRVVEAALVVYAEGEVRISEDANALCRALDGVRALRALKGPHDP